MAVRLSSDLIMDVMRNANPTRVDAAVAKLRDMGEVGETGFAFAATIDSLERGQAAVSGPPLTLPFDEGRSAPREAETPYQGFEKMVLRNLFEALLPDSASGAFGSGPSAGIWRSMAAEQMAAVYAEAGGAGIARVLEEQDERIASRQGEWPYFSVRQIDSFAG